MKRLKFTVFLLAAAGMAVLVLNAGSAHAANRKKPKDDAILKWNAIALQATADDHSGIFGPPVQGGPCRAARALAIVHIAIYDAVNAIKKTHDPYLPLGLPDNDIVGASVKVAVAQAAHDTLTALYPAQFENFSDELFKVLFAEESAVARSRGQLVRARAAANILLARNDDGAADGSTPIHPGTSDPPLPGEHQKDPTNPNQPLLDPGWGQVDTFGLFDPTSAPFRIPPPPALDSEDYTMAFLDVQSLGGDKVNTPTDRTREQKEIGIFWAYDGTNGLCAPPRLYNQIARVVAEQEGNTLVQNARLFALINLAMSDAGVVCWDCKYLYNFWRPIVGIRNADVDGNDDTPQEADWTALGVPASNESNGGINFTPPFPAYPSGHATFGGAFFGVMRRFYCTDDIAFEFNSDEFRPKTTDNEGDPRRRVIRSFENFTQAEVENGRSRIYLGIHWQFDADVGISCGNVIADHVFDNFLQPAP